MEAETISSLLPLLIFHNSQMSVSHKQEKWAGKHPARNSILRQRNTIFPKSFLPNVLWNELFKTICWEGAENPSLQKAA